MPNVLHGHDMSGTTANRPTNAQTGQPYFDTDLNVHLTYNGSGWVTEEIFNQAAPAAITVTATLTAAQVVAGLITANQGAGAAATYTFPTGTLLEAALPAGFATDNSFLFRVVNISTNALEIATIAAGTGITLVGNVTVAANNATTTVSFATFLVRRTAANTFSVYRVG